MGSNKQEFDVIFDTGSAVSHQYRNQLDSGFGSKIRTAQGVPLSIGMMLRIRLPGDPSKGTLSSSPMAQARSEASLEMRPCASRKGFVLKIFQCY